jgi:ABC-type nitrate/sulfonate/bicarbonate transport system ATPase subunit
VHAARHDGNDRPVAPDDDQFRLRLRPARNWHAPCTCSEPERQQRRSVLPSSAKLQLHQLSVTFTTPDGPFRALAPVDLTIQKGRFVSIIGPSGCGKSTIFNVVAGLQAPTGGRVLVDGDDATGTIGRVGYMLQKDLLLPWRTVLDNVILGMEVRGVPVAEARKRALPYLHRYGLGGFEERYPRALSGGMRQRAALLRTLLFDSDLILLDEPFGALDAQTKARMQEWLLTLWADFGKTVVFVTHDVEEAVYLSDEIYVMASRPGRIIERIDVPLERPRPRSLVTEATFIALKQHCLELLGHDDMAAAA